MGACNETHAGEFKHLELDVEGLDLSELDLGNSKDSIAPESPTRDVRFGRKNRLPADLARVLEGVVPPNTTRETATPV